MGASTNSWRGCDVRMARRLRSNIDQVCRQLGTRTSTRIVHPGDVRSSQASSRRARSRHESRGLAKILFILFALAFRTALLHTCLRTAAATAASATSATSATSAITATAPHVRVLR